MVLSGSLTLFRSHVALLICWRMMCQKHFIFQKIRPEASFLTMINTLVILQTGGVCPSLLSRDCKDPKVIIVPMKIIQAADLNHYGNDQMNRIYSPEGLAPTLKTVSGGGT